MSEFVCLRFLTRGLVSLERCTIIKGQGPGLVNVLSQRVCVASRPISTEHRSESEHRSEYESHRSESASTVPRKRAPFRKRAPHTFHNTEATTTGADESTGPDSTGTCTSAVEAALSLRARFSSRSHSSLCIALAFLRPFACMLQNHPPPSR